MREALKAPRAATSLEVSLTESEAELLRHVSFGLTNKQVAAAMNLSYETIKEHVQHLLAEARLDRPHTGGGLGGAKRGGVDLQAGRRSGSPFIYTTPLPASGAAEPFQQCRHSPSTPSWPVTTSL